MRCYTDTKVTKSASLECGLPTGCIKIFIDSDMMLYKKQQNYGYVHSNQPCFGDIKQIPFRPGTKGTPSC